MTNTDFRELFRPLRHVNVVEVLREDGVYIVRSLEPLPCRTRVDVLWGSQWTCGTVVSARRLDAMSVRIAIRKPSALDELEASCLTRSSMP